MKPIGTKIEPFINKCLNKVKVNLDFLFYFIWRILNIRKEGNTDHYFEIEQSQLLP